MRSPVESSASSSRCRPCPTDLPRASKVNAALDVVVGIGDTRTVRSASVLGLLGTDLVVSLDFTDGSEGYFLAIVPEPGTGVLVALGVAAVAIRRPRVVRGDSSGSARAAVSLARYASPW